MLRNALRKVYRLALYPNRWKRLSEYLYLVAHREQARARNLELNLQEIRDRAIVLKSFPRELYIDPIPACNLRCPLCPTTNGWSDLRRELLTPVMFNKMVAKLPLNLMSEVFLYNWGEPFLNKHLLQYIRYFSRRRLRTRIDSNLSLKAFDDSFMEDVVRSGLDELCASIDGATQETYLQYRIGGDFDRVIGNLKRLSAARRRLGSQTPIIKYKMLLNRFNESEVDQARALAEECGVLFVPLENFGGFPEEDREKWIATSVQEKYGSIPITMGSLAGEGEMPTECRQLWDSFFINSNGDVFPCCRICKHKWNVGNILEQSFDAIWNGGRMQALRRYVADPDAPAPEFENYCVSCEHRHCRRKSPVKR